MFSDLETRNCRHIIFNILSHLDYEDLPNLKTVSRDLKNAVEQYERIYVPELKNFQNTIFVNRQNPNINAIGLASFHFNGKYDSYIDFSKLSFAPKISYSDGSPSEKMPARKYFTDVEVDYKGKLTGTIDWAPQLIDSYSMWIFQVLYDSEENWLYGWWLKIPADVTKPVVYVKIPDNVCYTRLNHRGHVLN